MKHVVKRFSGLQAYPEVRLGRTIVGRKRSADILVVHSGSGKALALEAKYQDGMGTTDEKIPYAIDDCKAMPIPGFIVWAGKGFVPGVRTLLRSCGCAVEVEVEVDEAKQEIVVTDATELEAVLAMHFAQWPEFLKGKVAFKP